MNDASINWEETYKSYICEWSKINNRVGLPGLLDAVLDMKVWRIMPGVNHYVGHDMAESRSRTFFGDHTEGSHV